MKKLFFFTVLLLLNTLLNAQSFQVWDFEEDCSNNANSFFLGCIPSAISTHGTPDNRPINNLPAPSGSLYAHMYSTYDLCTNAPGEHGEGIALNFNFKPNTSYTIQFQIARLTNIDALTIEKHRIGCYLTNGLQNFGGPDNTSNYCFKTKDLLPAVPAGSNLVGNYSAATIPFFGWVTKNIQVTTNNQSFSQLWILPRTFLTGNAQSSWQICVDKVIIQECPQSKFAVSLCKIGRHNVRVSLSGATGLTGNWKLYEALSCSGGTLDQNLGTSQVINWNNPNKTEFTIPAVTGCYVLEQTIPGTEGCPTQTIRKLIDSNYGSNYGISGAFTFTQETSCDGALTYKATCTPTVAILNGIDHWTVTDLSDPNAPPIESTAWQLVLDALLTNHTYRIEHYVSLGHNSEGLCIESEVNVFEARCGTTPPGMAAPSSAIYTDVRLIGGANVDQRSAFQSEGAETFARLSPNPMVFDYVILKNNSSVENMLEVTIFDLNGRILHHYRNVTDQEFQIDRNNMTTGVYLVKVQDAAGFQQTMKLVVQ